LGPLTTPAALADAADAAVADQREARAEPRPPGPPSRLRRALPWIAAAGVIGAVGVGGWLLGLAVGDLPRRDNGVDAIVSTATDGASAGTTGGAPLDLSRVVVRDFDPYGDKQENPDQVRNAVDLAPTTAWVTDLYRTASFGGLKPGVGLLLDLGRPLPLHQLQVGFTAPGAHVELKVADALPADAAAAQTVAVAGDGKQIATLTPAAGVRARYVVVWVTLLPKDGDGYRVGISELRLR
ncbi:MAG: hypothetical protein WCD35_14945, partial [Mycobacteriales bacterium]